MRHEIRSAAYFLSDLLRLGHSLTDHQLDTFRGTLEDLLRKHYQHHWFPERPTRGSGYRCIRINHKMDPLIAQAANSCGVNDSSLLRNMFPNELTLWIDPREVSYRIGENGSICVIYDGLLKSSNTNITTTTTTTSSSYNNNNNNNVGSPNKSNTSSPSSSPNNHHHHHHHQQHLHQQQQQHHFHHYNNNNQHNHHQSPLMNGGGNVGVFDRYATCKESVRGMDHLIIDNRHMSMEQFAPYVSS